MRELLGRDVEIVIRELLAEAPPTERHPLRGSVLRHEDPLERVEDEDWEAVA